VLPQHAEVLLVQHTALLDLACSPFVSQYASK